MYSQLWPQRAGHSAGVLNRHLCITPASSWPVPWRQPLQLGPVPHRLWPALYRCNRQLYFSSSLHLLLPLASMPLLLPKIPVRTCLVLRLVQPEWQESFYPLDHPCNKKLYPGSSLQRYDWLKTWAGQCHWMNWLLNVFWETATRHATQRSAEQMTGVRRKHRSSLRFPRKSNTGQHKQPKTGFGHVGSQPLC